MIPATATIYIKAAELVSPMVWVDIIPLIINGLGDGHTHAHACKLTKQF